MAKNFEHISHIKSSVIKVVEPEEFYGLTPTADNSDNVGSSPVKLNIAKRPTADQIVNGEIAVNYLKGHETLTIKNTENEIVGFVNENELYETQEIIAKGLGKLREESSSNLSNLEEKVTNVENKMEEFDEGIEDLELIISSSLNDLNSRIREGGEELQEFKNKTQQDFQNIQQNIDNNELVISSSLNDLNARVNNLNGMNDEVNTLKATIKALSNILMKGHEYVDLGLPSGTLWATMNVGATKPEEYGLHFQWGDTQGYTAEQVSGTATPHKAFSWEDYKFSPNGDNTVITKYNETDGKTVLDLEDDAAHVNWGGEWHMPTQAQFQELLNTTYVTNAWVTDYQGSGVNGRLFTSVKNGNAVFIPAAGEYGDGTSDGVGNYGKVWTSDLSDSVNSARNFTFSSDSSDVLSSTHRCIGYSVRAVIG